MAKKPDLDAPTLQIAQRLLRMPPKPHEEMKIGRPRNPKHKNSQRKPKAAKAKERP
jgi:hypothetical protein